MLRRVHRLSKPIRVLLFVALPVFLGMAYVVDSFRAEEQYSQFRLAWQLANWGDTAEVKGMLHQGKINQEDLDWMLVLAAEDNFDEAVKTLLMLHAHTGGKDDKGHTALQISQNKGYWKVVRLLDQATTKE